MVGIFASETLALCDRLVYGVSMTNLMCLRCRCFTSNPMYYYSRLDL